MPEDYLPDEPKHEGPNEFQKEYMKKLVTEKAEQAHREGKHVHYMGVPVDETWSKEALIGLVKELCGRAEQAREYHLAERRMFNGH